MATTPVNLPEGMTKEEFDKLFGTFLKTRISGKARDKAIRSAQKELIGKHKPEYDGLVAKYMPK